ncbi:MAG: M56 family metallopeptidase [Candidatus Levybacteria bacterium]|nr:M56 family metallopeptidase [Candidatus Levybacteria bacterium]
MIRVNKNLVFFSGLFLFAGTILFLGTEKFLPLFTHATYYCQSFINTHMTPIPHLLSTTPVAVLVIIAIVSFTKLLILLFKAWFIRRSLGGEIIAERRVDELIRNLGLEKQTSIVKSNRKFAFCLGFRRPKIYLSTGLISKLSLKEIEAVLRHEQYHLENLDTLTQMIASTAYSLFPIFPLVGDLIKKYRIEREIQADKFAVSKIGNTYPLVSALRKFLAFTTVENLALAAIADQDTLEPRIYSLINKSYNRRQFRLKHLLLTIFSSLVIGAIFITPIYAKEIHSDNQDVVMLCGDGGKCANSCTTSLQNLNKSKRPINQMFGGKNASNPYSLAH